MGLARYALAFGLGFAAGHPTGRAKLQALPAQAKALAGRPEARRLREKGKAAAGQAVQTAKDRIGDRSSGASSASVSTEPAAETATRTGTRPLGRHNDPVVAQGAAATGDAPDAATHGTLPPSRPGSKS
jgi:hypothetical protein